MTSRTGDWLVRRAAHGSVPRLWMGKRRLIYLLGSEANEMIFANDDKFRVREAFVALEIVDGPTSVVLSDGPDHARRRALVRPSVAPRRIDGYLATMAESADEELDSAPTRLNAYAAMRSAIRRSTLRTLFGEALGARADEIGEMLQPLLDLADVLPQTVAWKQRLRTPAWRRGISARTAINQFIAAEIDRIRRVPADDASSSPMLHTLVHGRDGAGSGLSDEEIRDQAVTMIAAGYETTSAAMGWAVYLLGAHPTWQQRVRAEISDVLGESAPGPTDLPRLSLTGAVITEALRLYPPAMISARFVVEGFDFRGTAVRPGDLVIYSPYATHRYPSVYDDPTRFRPDRWIEQPRRPIGEYVPFGGGAHRCLGSHLALAELTVMLARLLARGPFELRRAPSRARGYAAMRPAPGVEIEFV